LTDLLLSNCRYITSSGLAEGSILINKGRIAAVHKSKRLIADRVVDCKNKLVMPGAIDVHVHIYSPGWIAEDFRTGTAAAAAGGVTTVLDMPSQPPRRTNTLSLFVKKRRVAERTANVNVCLYGGEVQTPDDVAQIRPLAAAGAVGFKFITGGAGFIKDDTVLYTGFEEIKKANSIAVVHAENDPLVELFRSRLISKRKDPAAFLDARPGVIEEEALGKSILFARNARSRLHVAHLPSKRGVEMVAEAKRDGLPVTAETCPHYLMLSRRDYKKYRHLIIVTPPIRELSDQKALWDGLKSGVIDAISTDHCPYPRRVKDAGKTSAWKTPPGMPGLETLLPLMITQVNKGRLSWRELVRLTSASPARIFGLPRKGRLEVGADADIVVVDPKRAYRFSVEEMKSVGGFSPFEGWRMKGKSVMTIVNGRIVMEEGQMVERNQGRFVKPQR